MSCPALHPPVGTRAVGRDALVMYQETGEPNETGQLRPTLGMHQNRPEGLSTGLMPLPPDFSRSEFVFQISTQLLLLVQAHTQRTAVLE